MPPFARAALLAIAALLLLAAPAQARTDDRAKPIVFVHGLDAVGDPGVDCASTFGNLSTALTNWGHSAAKRTVAYYQYDKNCSTSINGHGSHGAHYGSGHYSGGGHGAQTDIRHLAYHFAWYIHNAYSQHGTYVDLVGHSMGGLIIRYAVAATRNGLSGFPPVLRVEDAVTLGSPHGGSRAYATCTYLQCEQMRAGSSFLVGMESSAWNPQGYAGTDWSSLGSDDDDAVAADRAVGSSTDRTKNLYFGGCHKYWYTTGANIEHSDFMHDNGTTMDYPGYFTPSGKCGPTYSYNGAWYRPGKLIDLSLTYGTR